MLLYANLAMLLPDYHRILVWPQSTYAACRIELATCLVAMYLHTGTHVLGLWSRRM